MRCDHNNFTTRAFLLYLFDKLYAKTIGQVIIDKNKGEMIAITNDITGFCKAGSKKRLHISLPQNITQEKANVLFVVNDKNRRLTKEGVRFEGGVGTINCMISITHIIFRSIILPNSFIFFQNFNPAQFPHRKLRRLKKW
jgi:hypothetical protein